MTTPGDINVRPDELRTHASHVDDDAYELNRASDAAGTVSVDGNAFGKLIGFVGGWFMDKEADLASAFRDAVTMLHDDGSKLSESASAYETTDRSAAKQVGDAGGSPRMKLPL
jgi:uncharacterized protein YukE